MHDRESLTQSLKQVKFTFAKTYADSFPHEYILRKDHPELFDKMQAIIFDEGYDGRFYKKVYRYLRLDGYKYWTIDEVLNREPLEGYPE